MALEDHAQVELAEFKTPIPLIGIAPSATTYECDLCHENPVPIKDLELNEAGNQFLCPKCRRKHD